MTGDQWDALSESESAGVRVRALRPGGGVPRVRVRASVGVVGPVPVRVHVYIVEVLSHKRARDPYVAREGDTDDPGILIHEHGRENEGGLERNRKATWMNIVM